MQIEGPTEHLPYAIYLTLATGNLQKTIPISLGFPEVSLKVSKTLTEQQQPKIGTFEVGQFLISEFHIDDLEEPHDTTKFWNDFASKDLKSNSAEESDRAFQFLNYILQTRTFVSGGYHLTFSDFLVYEALQNSRKVWKGYQARYSKNIPHLCRWLNFLDSLTIFIEANRVLVTAMKKKLTTSDILETEDSMKSQNMGEDLAGMEAIVLPNAKVGAVVTRFPPEPSGYLHVGHAKAAMLNFFVAKKYKGQLILRFDDTNPAKEKKEYEEAIIRDLALIGISYDRLTYSSDSFEHSEKFAEKLIMDGKAYVDNLPKEEMQKLRAEGIESSCRSRSIEENLKFWKEMLQGSDVGRQCCLRAKMDPKSPNFCMRDAVLYRCKTEVHPRTGNRFKAYPTYDFICPIVDSLEGVTHTMRTTEYHDRNEQYNWIINALGIRKPEIFDYSRLNLTYTVMSKRKLQMFVDEGFADDWADPRFPTIQGLLRRGLTVEALKRFLLSQLGSRTVVTLDIDKLWTINKQVIDPIVPRFTVVKKDKVCRLTISGIGDEKTTKLNPKHPKNKALGTMETIYFKTVLLDYDEANDIKKGEEITLRYWGNVKINEILNFDSTGVGGGLILKGDFIKDGDPSKTEKKIPWLADFPGATMDIDLVFFEPLITVEAVSAGDDFSKYINKNSKAVVKSIGDANMKSLKKGDQLQIEKVGYFIVEQPLPNGILFNTPGFKKAHSIAKE